MEFELHTLDQRFGKFEGVQQQHDQRLADIERRLGTIEVLIADVRAEAHREREALRTELMKQINAVRAELTGQINALRTELMGQIAGIRTELNTSRTELNGRIDRLSDKIDALYKWIIGILIAVGVSVIASMLKEFF